MPASLAVHTRARESDDFNRSIPLQLPEWLLLHANVPLLIPPYVAQPAITRPEAATSGTAHTACLCIRKSSTTDEDDVSFARVRPDSRRKSIPGTF